MCFGDNAKKGITVGNRDITQVLEDAKNNNKQIKEMIKKIEDASMQVSIIEICETTERIIATVETSPKKFKRAETFFDYYLPMTLSFLNNYDNIENQKLTSKESIKFMNDAKSKIDLLNKAFQKQLSSLYQNDIVNMDAEMKVLDMMLKSDGLGVNEIGEDK